MAVTVETLKALVVLVEGKVAALPAVDPSRYDSYTAHREAAEALLADLARDHRAVWRSKWDGSRLSLAGITCTCTAGAAGVIQNWLSAARKRIAVLERAA